MSGCACVGAHCRRLRSVWKASLCGNSISSPYSAPRSAALSAPLSSSRRMSASGALQQSPRLALGLKAKSRNSLHLPPRRRQMELTCKDRRFDELHQFVHLREEIHRDLEVATGPVVKAISNLSIYSYLQLRFLVITLVKHRPLRIPIRHISLLTLESLLVQVSENRRT